MKPESMAYDQGCLVRPVRSILCTICANLVKGYIARKLCPDLIFVKLNMSRYTEVSKRIMAIFRQYDPNMLAASVDEAYLKQVTFSITVESFSDCFICASITEYCAQHNLNPDECVEWMRQRVFDETKLTVSAGIAANKVCLQPFLYLVTDLILIAVIPDASQSMLFIYLSTARILIAYAV